MMASNKTGQGQWHDRDAWLIVLMRGLRSCAYGMLAVLLAVTLNQAADGGRRQSSLIEHNREQDS